MVYLLHFDQPISPHHTTQHYVGYSADLSDRITAHLNGTSGVRLLQVAHQRGIRFSVVRVWSGNRTLERHLKSLKNAPKFCPCCNQSPWQLHRPNSMKPVRELTGNTLKEAILF